MMLCVSYKNTRGSNGEINERMQANHIRTLAEYIADRESRYRDNYRATSGSSFDTTIENHSTGDQGDRSGDERRDQDPSR